MIVKQDILKSKDGGNFRFRPSPVSFGLFPEMIGHKGICNHLGQMVYDGRDHGHGQMHGKISGPDNVGDRQRLLRGVYRKSRPGRTIKFQNPRDAVIRDQNDGVQRDHKEEYIKNLRTCPQELIGGTGNGVQNDHENDRLGKVRKSSVISLQPVLNPDSEELSENCRKQDDQHQVLEQLDCGQLDVLLKLHHDAQRNGDGEKGDEIDGNADQDA